MLFAYEVSQVVASSDISISWEGFCGIFATGLFCGFLIGVFLGIILGASCAADTDEEDD